MPRRGERSRDFHHQAPQAPVVRVGIRQAMTADVRGFVRPSPFDPAGYACRRLAEELADEWVEFVEVSRVRVGTTRNYRQAIEAFCQFTDGQLGERAPQASMARPDPDMAVVVLAWERQLPAQSPLGSTRPAVMASAIRTLINRRGRHPDRPVDPGLGGLAAGQHALHWGSSRELDEFSRKDKAALVQAAWKDSGDLAKRLAAGRALAATGGHPAEHGWLSLPNLLWGLADDAVTPREIARQLRGVWPAELSALVVREDVRPSMRVYFLILALLEMLYPTQRDLHAFRVLLVAATGHAPEELTGLDEDDVEFVENGVRLTLTKHRARRIRRRAFTRIAPAGTEEEVQTHSDRPRLEVSEILRRLLEVTAPLREKAEEHPAPLFMQASMSMKYWEVNVCRFNPCGGPRQSFQGWLDKVGLQVEGRADVRRLRKSTKVEKAIAFGGRIADIADDHHEETFRGHYGQGTTLRVVSGKVITSAQQAWFDKATAGPVVLDDAAASSASPALAELGLTPEQAEDLRAGALDMGVTSCRDPFDSPFSAPGQLCAVAPLRCLECRNAWILPSNLPQLLLFADHLAAMQRRLSPVHFHTLWGQSAANLAAVLADRTDQEIATARRHIADGGVSLQLPLAARAEFDA